MNREEIKKFMNDVEERMKTPVDLSKATIEKKTDILTLHFIGYLVKPLGIEETLYKECLLAFCDNRGKYEWEAEAIRKVLLEKESKEKQ